MISPEGCAGILWRVATEETKALASAALGLRADDLKRLGVIDQVVPEPLGGAHRAPREMASTLKSSLARHIRDLSAHPVPELLATRYAKFRQLGVLG